MKIFDSGCIICGADLTYYEDNKNLNCSLCGKEFNSNVSCINEHFICDNCHLKSADNLIQDYCAESESSDPFELIDSLMKFKAVKMHGPEHHLLVPAVLVTVYSNIKKIEKNEKIRMLKEADLRSKKVPGGFCGLAGACGAGIGTGIFISIILKATPLSRLEWKLANEMSSMSLKKISENGGPRCCKRNTWLAIETALLFLKEHKLLDIDSYKKSPCEYDKINKECLGAFCKFNRLNSQNKKI